MAKTLLNAVNEVLTRVGIIAGDSGDLTTLTDSARQRYIDVAVQVINEGIDELYTMQQRPMPSQQKEATLTLLLATRAYTLATDLLKLRWPLIDKTNNQFIVEFPGGYNEMLVFDTEQTDTGLPMAGAIRPTDAKLFLDRAPTATEAGRLYTYQYDRDMVLDSAADTVPFSDAVFRDLVPAWAHLWERTMRGAKDAEEFKLSLGRAGRHLPQIPARDSYSPR